MAEASETKSSLPTASEFKQAIAQYYTKLSTNGGMSDLEVSSCPINTARPKYIRSILAQVAEEVSTKYYGCGSPVPSALEGCTVLDLGSGTGRDCFVVSKLVGQAGSVIGVDMTPAQLDIANKYIDFHTKQWGFSKPNIVFKQGLIEDLASAGIADNSVDVVISNCVINLSANKEQVFREIYRVLKPGGEVYFSDIFADRRIPQGLMQDAALMCNCVAGAMYTEDFRRILQRVGFNEYRLVASKSIDVDISQLPENVRQLAGKLGGIKLSSRTVRAFKIAELEDREEDYGQVAYYHGTVTGMETEFTLDDGHVFPAQYPVHVSSNTAAILTQSRLKAHFTVQSRSDTLMHFGAFKPQPQRLDQEQEASASPAKPASSGPGHAPCCTPAAGAPAASAAAHAPCCTPSAEPVQQPAPAAGQCCIVQKVSAFAASCCQSTQQQPQAAPCCNPPTGAGAKKCC